MKRQTEDHDIQDFFDSMIEKDLGIQEPEFPEFKKSKQINWWIPIGIAASLVLGFFFFVEKEHSLPPIAPISQITPNPPVGEVVIITLEEGPDKKMQFNIEHTTEMDIWESPTASLLTEY